MTLQMALQPLLRSVASGTSALLRQLAALGADSTAAFKTSALQACLLH